MLDEINAAVTEYNTKWQSLVAERQDKQFFESLRPVAIGWKVSNLDEYKQLTAELHDSADLIIQTWMNQRWISKIHLKETMLNGDISIIKIMQRRPGSEDVLGLDHIDFYGPNSADCERVMKDETGIKWSVETNDHIDDYNWVSIWFDSGEAKLKDYTILGTISDELISMEKKLLEQ